MNVLRRWRDLFASLGESLIGVAEAEVSALKHDLRYAGRRLSTAIALGVAAAILAFWAIGATGLVTFQVLILWLPGWGAALIVLGILVTVTIVLGMIARQRLRELEAPMDTVRRRIDDHKEWWQSSLLVQEDQDDRSRLADRNETEQLDP